MKYKYYFRKPKSEIVKDILEWLAIAGAIYLAGSSPYFVLNLEKEFIKWLKHRKYNYKRKQLYNTFYRLNKSGDIIIERKGHQIYIHLTQKGKRKANWMQIDALKIKNQKRWDKKWRLVIFDISQLKKIYREAFRGKLKELGFYPLQKSVWIHPFNCKDEIWLLKDFFGLNDSELRLVIAEDIGPDTELKKFFKIIK